ncbi:MAG: 30S ribosomal protein S16 [Desulfotomaculales bacterium]
MAIKIRLKRMGAKGDPFYRIVVADARSPRDGRFIEEIGYYDPLREPPEIKIDEAKALSWMKKGARLTETARALFKRAGVLARLTGESVQERS